jgi:ATP-dependent Zn protease
MGSGAGNGAMEPVIREKVNAMLEEELQNAIRIIEANKQAIDSIVDALMEKSHLKEDEIDAIFKQTVSVV